MCWRGGRVRAGNGKERRLPGLRLQLFQLRAEEDKQRAATLRRERPPLFEWMSWQRGRRGAFSRAAATCVPPGSANAPVVIEEQWWTPLRRQQAGRPVS